MKIAPVKFITNFSKIQFGKKEIEPRIPHGTDYQILDTLDLKRSMDIPKMQEALNSGDDISIDREKLIFSRISRAKKDAKEFIEENPEFCYDDVLQDLICFIVECTDNHLQNGVTYGSRYASKRDSYFASLLNNQSREDALIEELPVFAEQPDMEDSIVQSTHLNRILGRTVKRLLSHKKNEIVERNVDILLMYCSGYTQGEIAKKYNISNARVGHIIAEMLRNIRRTCYVMGF